MNDQKKNEPSSENSQHDKERRQRFKITPKVHREQDKAMTPAATRAFPTNVRFCGLGCTHRLTSRTRHYHTWR